MSSQSYPSPLRNWSQELTLFLSRMRAQEKRVWNDEKRSKWSTFFLSRTSIPYYFILSIWSGFAPYKQALLSMKVYLNNSLLPGFISKMRKGRFDFAFCFRNPQREEEEEREKAEERKIEK